MDLYAAVFTSVNILTILINFLSIATNSLLVIIFLLYCTVFIYLQKRPILMDKINIFSLAFDFLIKNEVFRTDNNKFSQHLTFQML